MPVNTDRNRCAPPTERKPFIARSRCLVGWWLFSARLLTHCDCRCSAGGYDLAVGGAVGAEHVGDDHPRHHASPLHQPAEETPGRGLVPAVLHEDVQDVAVLVGGPPQVLLFPALASSFPKPEASLQEYLAARLPLWRVLHGPVLPFHEDEYRAMEQRGHERDPLH
jgi:hypothetical protein